jgi:heterotetrameric sarcosine oxidase beta subunit
MPAWRNNAEVVIIGGGIMGASTAYYLAKRGLTDVVLLERDLLAQGSTGLSVGGIRQQFSHPANIKLSQESVRVFEGFEQEFGVDIKFRQPGYLFLTGEEETWKEFLSSVETQRSLGVPVETLTPAEISRRWPYVNVADVRGGTFGPKDGYADPYLVTMGFAGRARKLGVSIEELTKVTGMSTSGGRIQAVVTSRGPVSCSVVVDVAGPWAAEVAGMAGLELQVRPYRRQVFMTTAFDALPKPVPMIINQDVSFYLRGADPGIILGMSDPEEASSFHLYVDRGFMEKVVEAGVHRVPALEAARILRGWAGLYEVTPDDNPIIDEISSLPGFFCACGFSGHGFQQGPAVGRIMSELILDGSTDFDLTPFAYDRFGRAAAGEKKVV